MKSEPSVTARLFLTYRLLSLVYVSLNRPDRLFAVVRIID